MRGLFFYGRRIEGQATLLRALEEYEAAVALDPQFAAAHARIGIVCAELLVPGFNGGVAREQILARGFAATDRALALDSGTADAWVARGRLLAESDSAPASEVIAAYVRATTLAPQDADAQSTLASSLLVQRGDTARARLLVERALALDPTNPTYLLGMGQLKFIQHRFAEAARWYDSALAVAPGGGMLYVGRGMVRLAAGDLAGARRDEETAVRLGRQPWPQTILALIDARQGDTLTAAAVLQRLIADNAPPNYDRGYAVALLYLALQQPDLALEYLQRVWPRRGLPLVLLSPLLDDLRADPRFQRLVEEARAR